MTQVQNFTPLDLNVQQKESVVAVAHKEAEPLRAESNVKIEVPVQPEVTEHVEAKPDNEVHQNVEIVPEAPAITEEQTNMGITPSSSSFFIQGKKVEVPLSADSIEKGLSSPMNTGIRWMAEIVKYILAKFHMTIKKVSGVFQFVQE